MKLQIEVTLPVYNDCTYAGDPRKAGLPYTSTSKMPRYIHSATGYQYVALQTEKTQIIPLPYRMLVIIKYIK